MIRYYPPSKIKKNQKAAIGQFLLNNQNYTGSYYSTYDGKFFSGTDPITGKNEELTPIERNFELNYSSLSSVSNAALDEINKKSKFSKSLNRSEPSSYYPTPIEPDYARGYLTRYFIKRSNQNGYVIEISAEEFEGVRDGTVEYDISFYQTISILWKLTGPLNNKRVSQYDTRAGIIDTNKRLVETANKTFVGIKEFIGQDYSKFSRPTE